MPEGGFDSRNIRDALRRRLEAAGEVSEGLEALSDRVDGGGYLLVGGTGGSWAATGEGEVEPFPLSTEGNSSIAPFS